MNNGPQLYLKCEFDGVLFEYNGGKRRRFCSDACKQAAWRAAKQPVGADHYCSDGQLKPLPADGPCPDCDTVAAATITL